MASFQKKYAIRFVVGFGFLSGIFLAIGIDPKGILFKNMITIFSQNSPEVIEKYNTIFTIISTLIALITIYTAYKYGGVIGFIAISFAIISGLIVFSYPVVGGLFLLVGFILGYIAPKHKYKPV